MAVSRGVRMRESTEPVPWTVASAQHLVGETAHVPFLQRRPVQIRAAGLALAVALVFMGQLWAIWVWGLVLGLGLVWDGLQGLRAAIPPNQGPCRAINPIRSEGRIEVFGRSVPPKRALFSPLTSSKCAYFHYKVTELGDKDEPGSVLDEKEKLSNFWLKDNTWKIWMNSEGIEINFKPQLDADLRSYDQMPLAVRERFERIDFDPFLAPGVRKPVKLEELRLDPGDNVLLRGTVRRNEEGDLEIAKGTGHLVVARHTGGIFNPVSSPGAKRHVVVGGTIAAISLVLVIAL
ncbi:MAG: hypothetical protein V2A76_08135 [Planctomycetota bacterium]